MERNSDKKLIELGKFIVEFVNINRTEAAIKFLMEYIRAHFSFSDSFVKEVMKNIPLLSDRCGKFDQEQLDYFSLLYNRYCILDEIKQHIDRPKYDGRVTINDDGEPVLKISEMEDKEWEIMPEYNKPVSLQLERIEKYLDLDRSAKGTGKYFINKLQNNTLETEKLLKKLDKNSVDRVKFVFSNKHSLISDYCQIQNFRLEMKEALGTIAKDRNLREIIWLANQIALCRSDFRLRSEICLSESNYIIESIPLESESYFTMNHVGEFSGLTGIGFRMDDLWHERYIVLPLRYLLISFYKNKKAKFLIRICDFCHKLYFSSGNQKQRFCPGNKCRLSYHNRNRIESGEHAKYKREKRAEGAKPSYYG